VIISIISVLKRKQYLKERGRVKIYEEISRAIVNKEQLWIVTITENTGSIPGKTGMKMLVNVMGEIKGTVGGGLLEHWIIERIKVEKPCSACVWNYELNEEFENQVGMICGGNVSFLVEPLIEGQRLYLFGGGHCAMALSELASKCGFLVTVCDDRSEWASKDKHPFAFETKVIDFKEVFSCIPADKNAYYIIMTHGHRNDEVVLKQLIHEELCFIGMLGSKQKVHITFNHLLEHGISQIQLDKVTAPIGIPIGSHEPMEIAVSIVAQLIQIRNQKQI